MKIDRLSTLAQGIRNFCKEIHGDEMMPDAIGSLPENWAWLWFQLREAEDKPDWFPKGKYATLQYIESLLVDDATDLLIGAKHGN